MIRITGPRVFARGWIRRQVRPWLIFSALVVALSCLSLPVARAASAATTRNFTVSSTIGWQLTPINLKTGHLYALRHMSGRWTVDYRNFPYVGPGGYSNKVDSKIYQGCKYLSTSNYAVLLGSVGSGPIFAIGSGGVFRASNSGPLWLRINDDDACLGDNAGSVVMKIEKQPPTVTQIRNYAGYSASALTGTDRYSLAHWTVPRVTCKGAPGKGYKGRAAVWVGLWGSKRRLMQAGTNSLCTKRTANHRTSYETRYYAWYEFVPANPKILKMKVRPGDHMYAQVEYAGKKHGRLRFWYDVTNLTRNKQKTGFVIAPKGTTLANSAYWGGAIVEGLGNHLAKFRPIKIWNIGVGAAFYLAPAITRYQMGIKRCVYFVCVNDILATPSALKNDSFTVTWHKFKP